MSQIDYLLIGHMTADIVRNGRVLGGTVAYAAPVVRAFGQRVGLLTSAAACEPLLETITPYADIMVRTAAETTTFENIYQPSGERIQYVHEVAAPLTYNLLPVGWLNAPLVHLAPLVDEIDLTLAAQFTHATVMLTLQGCLRTWDDSGLVRFRRWLEPDILRMVDIVVFSKPDIAGAPNLEGHIARYAPHVIVTDSNNGGIYYHNGQAQSYAAVPVHEINPTGAGDVFAAALLASLPRLNMDIHQALDVAAYIAAQSVTRTGITQSVQTGDIEAAFARIRR